MKKCLSAILIIGGKGIFHNLNLQMRKINNEVIFLESYFLLQWTYLLTATYPADMQTECKFVVDFQCLCVNNFPNDK